MKPTPPVVRCKSQPGPLVQTQPAADEWVEYVPVLGNAAGMARLSKAAVDWINSTLAVVKVEKGLRKTEHDCLDKLEKEGLIQQ